MIGRRNDDEIVNRDKNDGCKGEEYVTEGMPREMFLTREGGKTKIKANKMRCGAMRCGAVRCVASV